MAKLATFFGIIVSMDKEDCERHKESHVHAWYAGHTASFNARSGVNPPEIAPLAK